MKKNEMILDVPEAGIRKMRSYEIVGMNPNNTDSGDKDSSSLTPDDR
jgi:hypothetical protein